MVDRSATRFAPPAVAAVTRSELLWLGLILLLGLAARISVLIVLHQPLGDGDEASYIEMARRIVAGLQMQDIYGNKALYSPGYPFALVPSVALFGANVAVARATNLVLGMITLVLLWWLARAATGRPLVALLATFGLALLVPAVAGVEFLQREHLSMPLLLAHMIVCVAMLDTRRPLLLSLIGGFLFGCGLYAGVSAIFTGAAFVAAVAWRRAGWGRSAGWIAAFAAVCLLTVAPYLARNDRVVGGAVFSTNGGINLYVGNNPAQTDGYFIGIDKTPIAHQWEGMRKRYGELGLDRELKRLAVDYIVANPGHTALLDMRKLVNFWLPDIPDASDEDHGKVISAIRWGGAVQHMLILALALVAAAGWRRWTPAMALILLAILAFWSIHGIVYMITRYREPAMPLMLVLAAVPLANWIERIAARRSGMQPAIA